MREKNVMFGYKSEKQEKRKGGSWSQEGNFLEGKHRGH